MIPVILRTIVLCCHHVQFSFAETLGNDSCRTRTSFRSCAASQKLYIAVKFLYFAPFLLLLYLLFNTMKILFRTFLVNCISVETHTRVWSLLLELYDWRMPESTIYRNIYVFSNAMSPEVVYNYNANA